MIILKSKEEIERIRESNRIVAEVLRKLEEIIAPGITTKDIDGLAEEMAKKYEARPAFKGYRGYPASVCTSLNSEVVHGIPSSRELQEGDIISLDFGIYFKGYYGDAAITVPVGDVPDRGKKLIRVTEESLYKGIDEARPGNRLGDISAAVQEHVEAAGFSVVRDFVGHGIGKGLHEDPQIPNYGTRGRGIVLREGMVFAIEPMVNEGTFDVTVTGDGWTVVTKDGKLSAHFEHTVAIRDNGPEILSTVG
ncbi:MAG TPA: type I methionyl aminopeptidase [Syntrophales bacterium]|nr:type I methionyl aminopeptidase [Syntrophales bacterium]HOP34747.1 type I methionyl aminopeptidase [Syntrophales bacterium]